MSCGTEGFDTVTTESAVWCHVGSSFGTHLNPGNSRMSRDDMRLGKEKSD